MIMTNLAMQLMGAAASEENEQKGLPPNARITTMDPENMPSFSAEIDIDAAVEECKEHVATTTETSIESSESEKKETFVPEKAVNENTEPPAQEEKDISKENSNIYDQPYKVEGFSTGWERFKTQAEAYLDEIKVYEQNALKKVQEAQKSLEEKKKILTEIQANLGASEKELKTAEEAVTKAKGNYEKLQKQYEEYFSDAVFRMRLMMFQQMQGHILQHIKEVAENSKEYDDMLLLEHKSFGQLFLFVFNTVKEKVFAGEVGTSNQFSGASIAKPNSPMRTMMATAMLEDSQVYAIIDQYVGKDDFDEVMQQRKEEWQKKEEKLKATAAKKKAKKPEKKKVEKKPKVSKAKEKAEEKKKKEPVNQVSIFDLMRQL